MRFLLDTNTVSDLIRNPRGQVARRISEVGERNVCTSIVVAAELRFGAKRRGSPRLTAQLESVLDILDVLPLEAPADAVYGDVCAHLEKTGQPIGANDLLIAAIAVANGLTLVTHNTNEFSRVPGLALEDWEL